MFQSRTFLCSPGCWCLAGSSSPSPCKASGMGSTRSLLYVKASCQEAQQGHWGQNNATHLFLAVLTSGHWQGEAQCSIFTSINLNVWVKQTHLNTAPRRNKNIGMAFRCLEDRLTSKCFYAQNHHAATPQEGSRSIHNFLYEFRETVPNRCLCYNSVTRWHVSWWPYR